MSRRQLITAIACLLGVAGNIACIVLHDCIGGHMQHPPYHILDYTLDVFWSCALVLAAWFSRGTEIKRQKIFFWLSVVLLPSRFFASHLIRLRFPPDLIDLLVMVYLASVSIKMIWRVLHISTNPATQQKGAGE